MFRCGHEQSVGSSGGSISCVTCGESGVSRVNAPAPTFTGHAHGPCAKFVDLPAIKVNLAEPNAPPLKLKPQGEKKEGVHG